MFDIDVDVRLGHFELQVRLPPHDGITVIVGPNGAGKSSLLKCVLGVVTPNRGRIRLGERTLFCHDSGQNVPVEDRNLGYVPQRYALFSHMTVAQNVAFGLRPDSATPTSQRLGQLLQTMDLEALANRRPTTLSGGEAQRVALARALAIEPHALILDEPTSALDASVRRRVRDFLNERLREIAVPALVVSHDMTEVTMLAGRVVVLEEGKVTQVGTLEALRAAPATAFVEQLLSFHV